MIIIYLYSFGDISFSFGLLWEDQVCCLESDFNFFFLIFKLKHGCLGLQVLVKGILVDI
jgi:hypothetical protein